MLNLLPTLFAWVVTVILIAGAYPFALNLTRRLRHLEGDTRWLAPLLTLAISTGTLTLLMFWFGWLGIHLSVTVIVIGYTFIVGAGFFVTRLRQVESKSSTAFTWKSLTVPERLIVLACVITTGAVLFTALYYPLYRDDTLGIYRPFAVEMFTTGALVPLTGAESLYRTYPMLVPMAYTFAYLASSWENDYLAKLIPTLLSLGCVPAAYALGKQMSTRLSGWSAAALLLIIPTFGRWASSAYTDLPMAFFYTLTALFALRLWTTHSFLDAGLAGAMLGLAMWTKNAALLGVPLMIGWLLWAMLNRRIRFSQLSISLIAVGCVGGAWYVRNMIGAGFIVPDTAWTEQAERSLNTLLVYFTLPNNFGITGLALWIGWLGGLMILIRKRFNAPQYALALVFTVPFFAAWWLFVSYDPRFLLLFLPIQCALAGTVLAGLWNHITQNQRPALSRIALGIMIVFAITNAWYSAEFKDEFLRNPLMSHAEKVELTRGDSLP